MLTQIPIKGTVHGKMIELEQDAGLPEGQKVTVTMQPVGEAGDALRRAFGAWSDDPEGLDEFLEQVYRDRRSSSRPEVGE